MVSKVIGIVIAIISMIFVAYVLFLMFEKTSADAAISGPRSINEIITTLAFFGEGIRRKKGIELTVNLVATVVILLVAAFMLFLIFGGVAAESGSSTGNFFYNIFDAILRSIPLVG